MICKRCSHSKIDHDDNYCVGRTKAGNHCKCPGFIKPFVKPETKTNNQLDHYRQMKLYTFFGSMPRDVQNALLAAKFGITPEEADQFLEKAVDKFFDRIKEIASE